MAIAQTKAEVIAFNFIKFFEQNNIFERCKTSDKIKHFVKDKNEALPYFVPKDEPKGWFARLGGATTDKVFAREWLLRIGACFAKTKLGEDQLFCGIILLNASKIYYLDSYLYVYRMRSGSMVNSITDACFGIFTVVDNLGQYMSKQKFMLIYESEFKLYLIKQLAMHFNYLPANSVSKYEEECKARLTPKEYKIMLKNKKHTSFVEQLLSFKNERIDGVKHKVITICGMKFRYIPKKK